MRGLAPSLLKSTLAAGTYFSTLYYLEERIKQLQIMNDSTNHFVSSATARTLQSITVNPLIVIKTRLEVIGFNEYNSMSDACRKIYVNEGAGGFWTGLKVSIIRDVPFSGIFYPIYNLFKKELTYLYEIKNRNSEEKMTKAQRLQQLAIISSVASFSANIASCTLTQPIDLIRTRIFFQHHNADKNQHYTGIREAFSKIYA